MRKIYRYYGTGKYGVTRKEHDMLVLLARGATMEEIAKEIGMSKRSVESMAQQMRACSGVRNTIALVVFALKKELITMAEIFEEVAHIPAASSKPVNVNRPAATYDNRQWI